MLNMCQELIHDLTESYEIGITVDETKLVHTASEWQSQDPN